MRFSVRVNDSSPYEFEARVLSEAKDKFEELLSVLAMACGSEDDYEHFMERVNDPEVP